MGEGHRMAAKRREWVRRAEDMREEARKAHGVANVVERACSGGGGSAILNILTVKNDPCPMISVYLIFS